MRTVISIFKQIICISVVDHILLNDGDFFKVSLTKKESN